ncbi:FAD-dependent thymidylate synthase [Aureimonas sp. Leaf454]|uniref:FAD-dependent thymidylate synthase n=1 Tax=Aureimonas sp. Leaf454 TaxID=1736381 RepID=UPI0006FD0128|nr:FAD-dependent thymidylate synthase [Aureimonas sp. Leaf454]KQT54607.1 FAD-dependent thymidylate synthase [Aureimonas sp. Leaf454]
MKVILRAITQPVDDCAPDTQALLAYFARVSSTANRDNHATGAKLVRRIIENGEWSPLEMISLVFEFETTRDIARQMLRHDIRPQEFSQRYAEVTAPAVFREARMQDPKDRQNSLPCEDAELATWWHDAQAEVDALTRSKYEEALRRGIAKEVARVVLPEGMTPSTLFFQAPFRNWFHYVQTRTKPSTQKEHREVAEAVAAILREQFPDLADLIGDRK